MAGKNYWNFITQQRSFAEYWKHFVVRLIGVQAFGYNSARSEPFGWNLGHSEYIVWSWLWQILGAIHAEARATERAEIFLSGKQRATSASGRPNFTKFAHKTWSREAVNPFEKHFWKFALKGSFFQKGQRFGKNLQWLQTSGAISTKWLQITESHDGLANLQNVDFPFVPFESTQNNSRGL